jgi:hypothetical protein
MNRFAHDRIACMQLRAGVRIIQSQARMMKTSEKLQQMEDVDDIMKMM